MDARRSSRRTLTWLALLCAGTSCSKEVLVAGINGVLPDSGTPPPVVDASSGDGETTPVAPSCDGTLFAGPGLPGIPMADQAAAALAGDWNGDGLLDLAVANQNLSSISVVMGRGDGTFASRAEYATGAGPVKLASGDLNGDRHPDLVIANSGASSATVLLGKGDGTFGARRDLTTGPMPQVVAVGDFTADGKADIVAGDTLFVGKGDGTFAHGVTYGYAPSLLAAGDVNGDGRLDLVVSSANGIAALVNRGDGTFTTKNPQPLQADFPSSLVLTDLDGDRKLDIVASSACISRGTAHLFTFLGAGDGTFGSERESDTEDIDHVCSLPLAADDIDGDGHVDLQFGTRETWFGNGDGTFRTGIVSSVAQADTLLSLADWNRDGKPDLAALDGASVLNVLDGHGDGTFGVLRVYPFATDMIRSVVLADATGDGQPDLLAANWAPAYGTSVVVLRRGNRDGTFAPRLEYPLGAKVAISVMVGDVDGDGQPDLVTTSDSSILSVALGTGDGRFGPSQDDPTPGWSALAIGDENGDGHPDLLAVNPKLVFSTLLGDGAAPFGTPLDSDTTLPPSTALAVGDLDGDGRPDVAILDGESTPPFMRLFFATPSGTMVENQDFQAGDAQGPLRLADLNRDGQTDLVASASNGQAVRVWLGAGAGTFGAPIDTPTPPTVVPPAPQIARPADVNGDGVLDLVVESDRVALLLGRGDGTFACTDVYQTGFAASYTPDSVFAADLNHDGKGDLVTVVGAATAVLLSH